MDDCTQGLNFTSSETENELRIELRIRQNDMEELQKWVDFITKQKEHNLHCTLNVVIENEIEKTDAQFLLDGKIL